MAGGYEVHCSRFDGHGSFKPMLWYEIPPALPEIYGRSLLNYVDSPPYL